MFTQPVSSPPPGPQTPSTISPSRTSRLRGLSYLRNYTQNHILSRDASSSSANAASTPRQSNTGSLTRSATYTAVSTIPHDNDNSTHRLNLVSSTPESSVAAQAGSTPRSLGNTDTIPEGVEVGNTEHPVLPSANTTIALGSETARTGTDGSSPSTNMRMSTSQSASAALAGPSESMPSIRFSAYYDPRSTRPSLNFSPISRTLPNGNEVIKVGRYSERDSQSMANLHGNQPSAAPVGFKSKVVSRRHCEFWSEDGKWFIKDESKAYPVNDGDIVQLGIDFKGGEENIFRCVKMRLELNRGWQNKPNNFNVAAHKRLRTLAQKNAAMSGSTSQDCSICLNAIAPCQSLFVSPCSHTWHFKCIKSLLNSPQYPNFVCPNCRAAVDLEDDVEEPPEDWQMLGEDNEENAAPNTTSTAAVVPNTEAASPPEQADTTVLDNDAMDVTVSIAVESPNGRTELPHATSQPLPIRNPASGTGRTLRGRGTPSPPAPGAEGPITPRNDAGPWVFDGTAGRVPADPSEMRSIDAAATDTDMTGNE